jgi:ubiquinone/menaquinone biosynthesis C-methylase UbiE
VADVWSERAEAYRTSAIHAAGEDLDLVVDWCEPAEGVTVLDVATGGGHVARRLRERGATVVTLDPAPGMQADTTAPAEQLPFADGSFDAVVLADVIEHIPRADRAVAEFARVLRPGGRLVMATPDRAVLETIERLDHLATSLVSGVRAAARRVLGRTYRPAAAATEAWERFFSRADLAELVTGARLRVIEHKNVGFYPGPEGGGTFALFLGYLAPFERLRERVLEPTFRRVFAALARLEVLNQKQLIVAEK